MPYFNGFSTLEMPKLLLRTLGPIDRPFLSRNRQVADVPMCFGPDPGAILT